MMCGDIFYSAIVQVSFQFILTIVHHFFIWIWYNLKKINGKW